MANGTQMSEKRGMVMMRDGMDSLNKFEYVPLFNLSVQYSRARSCSTEIHFSEWPLQIQHNVIDVTSKFEHGQEKMCSKILRICKYHWAYQAYMVLKHDIKLCWNTVVKRTQLQLARPRRYLMMNHTKQSRCELNDVGFTHSSG
jgi:hypothetical protein